MNNYNIDIFTDDTNDNYLGKNAKQDELTNMMYRIGVVCVDFITRGTIYKMNEFTGTTRKQVFSYKISCEEKNLTMLLLGNDVQYQQL